MNTCYLALGSNLKTAQRQLRQAIQHIKHLPHTRLCKIAPFYTNPAWGRKTQPIFCNTAVKIQTTLTPMALLKHCQAIELKQGRYRGVKYGARTIDIDIIFYQHQKVNTPELIIPHPHWETRDFVKIPLLAVLT